MLMALLMLPAAGFRYIVQARCPLSAWPGWRALHVETACTLAAFIFEDILCRWGAVEEIVTDNGTASVAALDLLSDHFSIGHIWISAYNSRANGVVERQHRTIRESIVKACDIREGRVIEPTGLYLGSKDDVIDVIKFYEVGASRGDETAVQRLK